MRQFREHITGVLAQACGVSVSPEELKESPVADFGSPIAFQMAKALRRNPKELSDEIAARIKPDRYIGEVSSEGGYVNFTINYPEACRMLINDSRKPKRKGVRILLEHTSVNPTGPVHVGRIRNTLIGDCLRRVLFYGGYDVDTHYYVNDIGKQVAIIASGLADGMLPDEQLKSKYASYAAREDYEVFFTYVGANKRFEEDEAFAAKVQSMIKAAESGDDKTLRMITSSAERCLRGQLKTFTRLGVHFDVFDYESALIRDGSVDEVMIKVRAHPKFVKNEVGEGLDLSGYGIEKRGGMSVLARSDGTSVYLARDVAYHLKKVSLADRLINVLGEDHKVEFQELKTILSEVFGVKKSLEAVHFSFVNFEGVKFSTRRGEIASADELLDEAVAKAQEEVKKREIGDELTAQAVGIGAVKFHIIKTTPNKQITFRWNDALNFEGDSGPYVQYAHARSCRILEKAGVSLDSIKSVDHVVNEPEEKKLVLKLLQFEDVAETAANQLRPDLVAAYLLDLTAAYGGFYMKCPVLDAEEKVRNRRLLLVAKTRHTIKTGLDLLGIEAPERM